MKNKNANKQLTKAELFSKIDQLYQPCSDPKSVREEDCKSCEQRLQEAIDLADRYGQTIKQADILLKLCSCGVNHAQYSQAWDRITQFFGLLGEDTSYPNLHRATNLRARLHWIKGDYQAAVTDYQKALELFRQANMLPEGAGMCMNISSLLSKWDEWRKPCIG